MATVVKYLTMGDSDDAKSQSNDCMSDSDCTYNSNISLSLLLLIPRAAQMLKPKRFFDGTSSS